MTKVYIGNLPLDVREKELDDMFYKFGRIRYIDIKQPSRPPAYAFVEYEDPRDAQEAVRRRDGIEFAGQRLRVEVAKGGTGTSRESFRAPRSTGYRVLVKGLPKTASWQDLKDHVRTAVKPMYTDVRHEGGETVGIVEFETEDDMRSAIRKLDDTEFKNPRYERGCYIRFIEDGAGGGRSGRGDDRGRGRSRSRSRSPRRRDSRERSASPTDRERDRRNDARSPARGRDRGDDDDYGRRSPRPVSRSRSRSVDSRD